MPPVSSKVNLWNKIIFQTRRAARLRSSFWVDSRSLLVSPLDFSRDSAATPPTTPVPLARTSPAHRCPRRSLVKLRRGLRRPRPPTQPPRASNRAAGWNSSASRRGQSAQEDGDARRTCCWSPPRHFASSPCCETLAAGLPPGIQDDDSLPRAMRLSLIAHSPAVGEAARPPEPPRSPPCASSANRLAGVFAGSPDAMDAAASA
jgi:hypothetical protein